jgi:hypothetical protein
VNLGEFVAAGFREQRHGAACANSGELTMIPGQEKLRAGRLRILLNGCEVGGRQGRCLVDHDQVSRSEPPSTVIVHRTTLSKSKLAVQPTSDVAGSKALVPKNLGRNL